MKRIVLFMLLVAMTLTLYACAVKNEKVELIAYVDEALSDAEATTLRASISQIPEVQQVQFVTRDEAWKEFLAAHEDDPALSGVGAEALRHRYKITVVASDADRVVEQLEKLEGIAEVTNPRDLLPFSGD